MEHQPMRQRMREWFGGDRPADASGAPTAVLELVENHVGPRRSVEGMGSPAEKLAYLNRVEDAADLVEHGRELTAIVLTRETSERRFNGAQIIMVELEIQDPEDPDSPRIVVYDHVFGPATARRWRPGHEIPIWIDPRDPERIYAGR